MRHPLGILLLAVVIVGCSPRIIYRTEIEHRTDSVIRERVIYDTATFYIENEVEKVIVRDSTSHLENSYAESDASIDEYGYLHHSLKTKPQTIYVPVEVEVADTTIRKSDTTETTKTIEVEKELSKWQLFQMGGFWALLSALAMAIYMKIKK